MSDIAETLRQVMGLVGALAEKAPHRCTFDELRRAVARRGGDEAFAEQVFAEQVLAVAVAMKWIVVFGLDDPENCTIALTPAGKARGDSLNRTIADPNRN